LRAAGGGLPFIYYLTFGGRRCIELPSNAWRTICLPREIRCTEIIQPGTTSMRMIPTVRIETD
jgi:hypothetical protein